LELLLLLLFESILLAVQHFIAFSVAHVAFVAHISEREVVVEAPLAAPVTHSALIRLLGVWYFRWYHLLHGLPLRILGGQLHVSWHTFRVFSTLGLFAPVAFFTALEVVVLALAALPATFGELEVSLRG
jgi:hypothetical protein